MKTCVLCLLMILIVSGFAHAAVTGEAAENRYCPNGVCDWFESVKTCPEDCEEKEKVAPPEDTLNKVLTADSKELDIDVDKEKISITNIKMGLKEEGGRFELNLQSKKVMIAELDKLYEYIEVSKTNLPDSQIGKVTVSFDVPSEWLETNGVTAQDMRLYYLDGQEWVRLKTTLVSEGSANSYEASLYGLHNLAIAASNIKKEPEPVKIEEVSEPETDKSETEIPLWLIGVIVGAAILLVIIFITWITRQSE